MSAMPAAFQQDWSALERELNVFADAVVQIDAGRVV